MKNVTIEIPSGGYDDSNRDDHRVIVIDYVNGFWIVYIISK